ncbi:cell division protein ZapE, partial [Pantoea agglomerans]|nr:cell division protein ZapE [Pantoea agglomerans]
INSVAPSGIWLATRWAIRAFSADHIILRSCQAVFSELEGSQPEDAPVLEINHRQMPTLGVSEGVLAINFTTLCGEGRSQ